MSVSNLAQNRSLFTVKKDRYGNTVLVQATGKNGGELRGSILKTNDGKPFLVAGKGIKIASGSNGYPSSGQIYIELDLESAGLSNLSKRSRSATSAGTIGPRGSSGPQGLRGPAGIDGTDGINGTNGTGVDAVAVQPDNSLVFSMSDGTSLTTTPFSLAGASVTSVVQDTTDPDQTVVTITWDDGAGGDSEDIILPHGDQGPSGTQGPQGIQGDAGPQGPAGVTGADGASVSGISIDSSNHLIFDMTGCDDIDAGLVPNAIGITSITSVNNGLDTTITITWGDTPATVADIIIPHPTLYRTKEVVVASSNIPAGTVVGVPDDISPIDLSLYDNDKIDVYINGVLAAEGPSLTYQILSGELLFNEDLKEGDVLSIIIQGS